MDEMIAKLVGMLEREPGITDVSHVNEVLANDPPTIEFVHDFKEFSLELYSTD
jgi:hypothetical protein